MKMKKVNRQEPRKATGRQGRALIPFAIAILAVLGMIFGGWGSVYAAQDSEPDDLLYPVKVAVDYLDELFTVAESEVNLEPSAIDECDGTQIHDRDRDRLQDMTGPVTENGYDWGEDGPPRNRNQNGQEDVQTTLGDLDLPIDDTLVTTPTISGTLTMSGTLYGPGPCLGDPENCELTVPNGYTYTYGMDDEAQFHGTPPLGGPPATDNPGDNMIGFGPGAPPTDVTQPVGNTPVGNSGSSGQKQGAKP